MTPSNLAMLQNHTGKYTDSRHQSMGKTVWKHNGKVVRSFTLDGKDAKKLRKLGGEADRREAFENKPLDVWVENNNGVITMSIRDSEGKLV